MNQFEGNNFFRLFKKNDFSLFWLNIFPQKNKKIQKWEKMLFDSVFHLAVVNLLGFDH